SLSEETHGQLYGITYVIVTLDGERFKTQTIEAEYDPEWNETFSLIVSDSSEEVVVSLYDWDRVVVSLYDWDRVVVSLYDWDRVGRDEYIGSVHIPLVSLRGATAKEVKLTVFDEKLRPVHGHNKQPTLLTLFLSPRELPEKRAVVEEESLVGDGEGLPKTVPYRLRLKITSAANLPRMDSVLAGGKADPFCLVKIGKQKQNTDTIKNNLDPTWAQIIGAQEQKTDTIKNALGPTWAQIIGTQEQKTDTIKNSLDPTWDMPLDFDVTARSQSVTVTVFDWNPNYAQ
ncbi:hypothetical protein T484DRAFT_1778814, partial [Baffinella frigidus]